MGGGNRGAIQAGALRALFETGFSPGLIVGISVGAINGAYLAFYPDYQGTLELEQIWRRLDGKSLFGTKHLVARTLLALATRRSAALSNRGLKRLLESSLPSRDFADTAVPFLVTATHLETGTGRILAEGNIVDAVLASSALPGFLPPVTVDGEHLIDGAVAEPVPLQLARQRGLAGMVVIDPGYACRCPCVHDTALAVVQHSVALLARQCVIARFEASDNDAKVFPIGLSCHEDVPFTDFTRTEEMLRSGYEEARRILATRVGVGEPAS